MISIARWVSWALQGAAAASLATMMLLTVADVAGRYFLDAPLRGAGELVGLLLGTALMCAMPLASAAGRHIAVSLLEERLGPVPRAGLRIGVELLSTGGSLLVAAAMYARYSYLLDTGERTQVLQALLWPSALVIAILWVCVALAHLAALFHPAAAGDKGPGV